MGSLVYLGIGSLELDWGKNWHVSDHSQLFQKGDLMHIPYYYAEGCVERKLGFSKPLSSVRKRLDLLGYSSDNLKKIYKEDLKAYPDYYPSLKLSYEEFLKVCMSIDLNRVELPEAADDWELGEYVCTNVLSNSEVKNYLPDGVDVNRDIGTFLENLHPYFLLALIAMNPNNLDKHVQWRFMDVVEGGYFDQDEFVRSLPQESKILVVTEGSSDTYIISRALELLMPDIHDFFYFVDMENNYPFTGTGNVFRFCQGLASINIQNKVLIILDNDAEGVCTNERCKKLKLPDKMHVCLLPQHIEFERIKTVGPSGEMYEDVNGRGVAIECFLDFGDKEEPILRWISYNCSVGKYHGVLENKEKYVKAFKRYIENPNYKTGKLQYLMEYIVDECVKFLS